MRKRLTLCSIIVAVVGLFCETLISLNSAENMESDKAFEFVMIDGKAYPIPLSNRMYQRELQRFGGKAAVLSNDFTAVAALWRAINMVTVI
jgi:hypothetical protein